MGRMLTDSEVEALPEDIRDHYRTHNWVRHEDDLKHFPPAIREMFERMATRGRARTLARVEDQGRAQAS